jgi:hypothetical protein
MNLKAVVLALLLMSSFAHGQSPVAPPGQVFLTMQETGFAFLRPKAWKLEKTKYETKLYIPVSGTHGPAVVHLFAEDYRLPMEDWQQDQVEIGRQVKATVDRQWQDEILGVPLLLTKITIPSGGSSHTRLTGLIYSATMSKFLFRLECNSDDFSEANQAWQTVLQTLRTTDGSKPQPDDPNRPLTKQELAGKPSAPLPVTQVGPVAPAVKPVLGPVTVSAKAGGKAVTIHLPAGWTVQPQSDGTWIFASSDGNVKLKGALFSELDSPPLRTSFFKQTAKSLDQFTEANDREEHDDVLNRAGAQIDTVWRVGKAGKAPLASLDGAVQKDDLYLLLQAIFPGGVTPANRKVANGLLEGTSLSVGQ